MTRPRASMRSRRRRAGTILIVTMLVSFALAGMVVVLCQQMRVERMAAANQAAASQASAIERGAEQYCLGILTEDKDQLDQIPETEYAAVHLGDGYFWVLRPSYDDETLPVFGFTGESAKVNINTASADQLMALPGMTDDVANAIVDWRDEDSDASPNGAESDYYLSLPEPYMAKNADFETVEELLMVRGITRPMLYGDGTAPPLGQPVSNVQPMTANGSTDPQLARGWADLLTCYSIEPNVNADGTKRINIKSTSSQVRDQLNKEFTDKLGGAKATALMNVIGSGRGRTTVVDVFDLYRQANLTADDIDKINDDITSILTATIKGRIDINTAPRDVLMCIDGLDESDVDKILAQRPSASAGNGGILGSTATVDSTTSNNIGWLVTALGAKAVGLEDNITTKSAQYSADILAVSGNGRAYKRVRVVIDTRNDPPTIIYRRDITDRGWPMDEQILASMRSGQGPGNWPVGSFSSGNVSGSSGMNSGGMGGTLGGGF
jgi:DNA uptake protein ComE-like DNA-binding protein